MLYHTAPNGKRLNSSAIGERQYYQHYNSLLKYDLL